MIRFQTILFTSTLLLSVSAQAVDVYKHIDETGKVSFSSKPTGNAEKIEINVEKEPTHDPEIIYQEHCPYKLTISRLCSVEFIEKHGDLAKVRIHYHYKKGEEETNQVIIRANMGSSDNIVGTKGWHGHTLEEGKNIIEIPFGLYRDDVYTDDDPYISKFIKVRALGIDVNESENENKYTSPFIFDVAIEYEYTWYVNGESTPWR